MLLAVAAWAVAEAILFFIVADVPISLVAVRSGWRTGIAAASVAAVAAAAGGAFVYAWAARDPAGADAAMIALPAIDAALVTESQARFAEDGYAAMFLGSLTGTPYKLYAAAAGSQGATLAPFLILSALARLPRFLFAAIGAAWLSHALSGRLSMRGRLVLLAGFWLLFYAWYFWAMPG